MQSSTSYTKTEVDLAIASALVPFRSSALEDILLNQKANVADTYSKADVDSKVTQSAAVAAAASATIQSEVSALQASLSNSQASLSAVGQEVAAEPCLVSMVSCIVFHIVRCTCHGSISFMLVSLSGSRTCSA